jgi:hypothetical protein
MVGLTTREQIISRVRRVAETADSVLKLRATHLVRVVIDSNGVRDVTGGGAADAASGSGGHLDKRFTRHAVHAVHLQKRRLVSWWRIL